MSNLAERLQAVSQAYEAKKRAYDNAVAQEELLRGQVAELESRIRAEYGVDALGLEDLISKEQMALEDAISKAEQILQ